MFNSGILLIANPCVTAARPPQRLDEDFLAVSLGKLKSALAFAKSQGLKPVIVGNLVAKPYERAVLHGLAEALIEHGPYYVYGDREGRGEDTTVGILAACRALIPLSHDRPAKISASKGDFKADLLLYGVSRGGRLPDSLPQARGVNVLVAHHPLSQAEGGDTMARMRAPAIQGCALAINGDPAWGDGSLWAEDTVWQGAPGLVRMTRSEADRTPSVLAVRPRAGVSGSVELDVEVIALPGVTQHVFEEARPEALALVLDEAPTHSDFATALAQSSADDEGDEASSAAAVTAMIDEVEGSEAVRDILKSLQRESEMVDWA